MQPSFMRLTERQAEATIYQERMSELSKGNSPCSPISVEEDLPREEGIITKHWALCGRKMIARQNTREGSLGKS